MKRHALMAALAFCLGASARADVIDLIAAGGAPAANHGWGEPVPNLAVTRTLDRVALPTQISELPEPEVFLMMLVGLVLIGYRANRDSSDKFT